MKTSGLSKILIYGTNLQAAALYTMIRAEEQAEVAAFVVDSDYRKNDTYCGIPVVDFENIEYLFSPDIYEICLSFGYKNMVRNREEKFNKCRGLGYHIYSFISKKANVYTTSIGEGCNIYPGTTIAPFVEIGKGSFIECGNVIAHHTRIGDFNFIAPGAHFCGAVTTGKNCFIGSASEIINGCTLGNFVFIGAMSKVSKNIKAKEVVMPPRSEKSNKTSDEMMLYMFNEQEPEKDKIR